MASWSTRKRASTPSSRSTWRWRPPAARSWCRSSRSSRTASATALDAGGKLIVFGNGGSAADAQHFAAELMGRFRRTRRALPAVALSVDSSTLTAIANDFSYDAVFERQVEAFCGPDDVVVGISTSGRTESVVRGLRAARQRGARTWALTGARGRPGRRGRDICAARSVDGDRARPGDAHHDHPRRLRARGRAGCRRGTLRQAPIGRRARWTSWGGADRVRRSSAPPPPLSAWAFPAARSGGKA